MWPRKAKRWVCVGSSGKASSLFVKAKSTPFKGKRRNIQIFSNITFVISRIQGMRKTTRLATKKKNLTHNHKRKKISV